MCIQSHIDKCRSQQCCCCKSEHTHEYQVSTRQHLDNRIEYKDCDCDIKSSLTITATPISIENIASSAVTVIGTICVEAILDTQISTPSTLVDICIGQSLKVSVVAPKNLQICSPPRIQKGHVTYVSWYVVWCACEQGQVTYVSWYVAWCGVHVSKAMSRTSAGMWCGMHVSKARSRTSAGMWRGVVCM